MNDYRTKIKHILTAYLLIVLTTVLGFGLFRWIFAIKWKIVDLKTEMWEMWIPFIFPIIPITIWLRPRLRILKFKDPDKGSPFLQMITCLTIFAMLLNLQKSISTTGELKTIKHLKTLKASNKADYYILKSFVVDTNYRGTHYEIKSTNKGRDLLFKAYSVVPVLTDTNEVIIESPKLWIGLQNKKEISNRLSNAEKEAIFKQFERDSKRMVNEYNPSEVSYYRKVPHSNDRDFYFRAIEYRDHEPADESYTVLEPQTGSYEQKTELDLFWFYFFFGAGTLIFCLSLIPPKLNNTEYKFQLAGKRREKDLLRDFFQYVIPKGDHYMTSIIINLNILVFLLMFFSGMDPISAAAKHLLEWGGSSRFETTHGEWWRLLTSIFVHEGIIHLSMCIFGLVVASKYTEPIWGTKKFLLFYLLFGILSNFSSLCFQDMEYSVGSSGAVFGLYGAIMMHLLFTNLYEHTDKNRLFFSILYIGIYFVLGLIGMADNVANSTGFILGACIGFLSYKLKDGWQEWV